MKLIIFLIFCQLINDSIQRIQGYTGNEKYLKGLTSSMMYNDFTEADDTEGVEDGSAGSGNGQNSNVQLQSKWNGDLSVGNLKQKETNIDHRSAAGANTASDTQPKLAQVAPHKVKIQLAEKPMLADRATKPALAGKLRIVEHLKQKVHEAEAVVQERSSSLQNAQRNLQAAVQAAHDSRAQLKTLTTAVKLAQSNAANAQQAAAGAQQEYIEKNQLLEAAKYRVETLLQQLNGAKTDFSNTKRAAYKTGRAGYNAKVNSQLARRHMTERILRPELRHKRKHLAH